jgi:hypothetical protein
MHHTEEVPQRLEEVQGLLAHLETASWEEADWGILQRVLQSYAQLLGTLFEAQMTLKRLQALLFGRRRRRRPSSASDASADVVGRGEDAGGGGHEGQSAALEQAKPAAAGHTPRSGGQRPGAGRLGAAVYEGAERVACRHEDLRIGEGCPVCGQGRLYAIPPGVEMRIDGNALLSAIRYEVEKLRCSACGEVFTAPLPEEAGTEQSSPQARAVLAVARDYLGLPLYRLESDQAMVGVPGPDATQWDQIERVADCAYVVFVHREGLAAQGELMYQDDTAVRILSLLAENAQAQAHAEAQGVLRSQDRTGMYTTALVVKVGEHTVLLYYSSRRHAGANLQALLDKREAGRDKPLVMSDALVRNEADEAMLIRCHCLAHGRRQFSELEEGFPEECRVGRDALTQVFDHEDTAATQQLGAQERLAYHQAYSGPIMDKLKQWLETQGADRLVEPNSRLGKAITYLLGPWETLTRFLSVPGAPLDNNTVERALKLFMRQRKNSLLYATEHSASIASVLTSLIATCLYAGVNALEYLVALQEHRAEVFAAPEAWLPWTSPANRAPPEASCRQSSAIRA